MTDFFFLFAWWNLHEIMIWRSKKRLALNFSLRLRHRLVPKPWGLGPRTSLVVTSKQDCRSTLIFRECLQFWTKLDWNYAWLPSTWYIFLVSICLIRKMCKSTFLFWRHQLTSPRSQALAVSNPNGREISRFQVVKTRWRNNDVQFYISISLSRSHEDSLKQIKKVSVMYA